MKESKVASRTITEFENIMGNQCCLQIIQKHALAYHSPFPVADPGIFDRGGSTIKLSFQRGGSTIIFGFQRGVPLSKCVILTLFWQNFLKRGFRPPEPPLWIRQCFQSQSPDFEVKRHGNKILILQNASL
jgi:hypothetical protein